jgi:hypothetical protein
MDTTEQSSHPQRDTGLGFECDEMLVDLIRIINRFVGITTQFSCQGEQWKEAYVIFAGALPSLLDFCTHLYPSLSPLTFDGGQRERIAITFENEPELGIRGKLTLPQSQIRTMESRLRDILEGD